MANELHDEIGKVTHQLAACTDPESRQRLTDKLVGLAKRLTGGGRKAEFIRDDLDGNTGRGLNVGDLYEQPARGDEAKEVARDLDRLYILGEILHRDPRQTKTYRQMLDTNPSLRKALDTSSGSDWIPTEFSASFHEKVRLQQQIVGLLEQVKMPTATYKLPVEGADARGYLIDEQGDADSDLDTGKRVRATLSSPALTNVSLSAAKIGCRTVCSAELVEESVVPMLEYLTNKLARALSQAREDACLNGKAGAALDADASASDDPRRWFNGLREIALNAAMGNGQAVITPATAGRIDINDLRKLRAKMKKFATRPASGDAVIVTGAAGYMQLLNLTDGNGAPIISTIDRYGSQATLVSGELARLDGMPIVLSDFIREDLNGATGIYDGVTENSTLVLMCNTKQFLFGTYRNPQVRSQPLITTDQIEIVALQRGDMKPWFATQPAVGFAYDVRF